MVPSKTRRADLAAAAFLAFAALSLLLSACASSPPPIEADPGIAASLSIVESRTTALFEELARNPGLPFAQAEGIYYRPLLGELSNAQHLAQVHAREQSQQDALKRLEQTYRSMREQHREKGFAPDDLDDYHRRIGDQTERLQRMLR